MTSVQLNPSSTTSSQNITIVPSGTAHGVTGDQNLATYVRLDEATFGDGGTWFAGAVADLALPAGAVITKASLWAVANTTLYGKLIGKFAIAGVEYAGSVFIGAGGGAYELATAEAPEGGWSDANLDAATYWIQGWQLHGWADVFEVYLWVYYAEVPELSVTAPTGTLTTNNRPTTIWTPDVDIDYGAPTFFEVKIFDDATYGGGGFDPDTSTPASTSGVTGGNPGQWTPSVGLTNDTYRSYVRIAQTLPGGTLHWSDWEFSGFTVNTPAPAVPSLVATAQPATARVQLDVDDNAGAATTDAFLIERSLDAGVTWAPVRVLDRTDGIVLGDDVTIWDYEAPLGREVRYRAYALHDYSGAFTSSLTADTDQATLTGTEAWLKCPELPALNMAIEVDSFATYTRQAKQTVVDVLGRTRPVVLGDGFGGKAGQIAIKSWSTTERDKVIALLNANLTLLLQMPDGYDTDREDLYLRMSQQDRTRIVDKAWVVDVVDALTWIEVDAPTGAVVAWP